MFYFEIELKSGFAETFNKKCNHINYADQHYLVCQHYSDSDKSYETLGLIPHDKIAGIYRREVKA